MLGLARLTLRAIFFYYALSMIMQWDSVYVACWMFHVGCWLMHLASYTLHFVGPFITLRAIFFSSALSMIG